MLQAVLTRFPVPVWFLTKESSWLSQISHVLRQEVKLCRGRVQTGGVSRPSSICFFPRSFLKKKRRRRRQRRRWRSSPWIFLPMHAALKQERISQTWRDYLLPEKPSACIRFQLWAYCTGFAKCSPSLHPDIMWYHVILKFVVMKLWPCIASVFSFCNVWHLFAGSFDASWEISDGLPNCPTWQGILCCVHLSTIFNITPCSFDTLEAANCSWEVHFIQQAISWLQKLWHSMELSLALKCHDDTVSCVSFFRCVFWSNMMWTAWTWLTSAFQANIRSWCRAYPMYSTSVQRCIVEENPRGYAQELLSTPSNDYLSSRFSDVFSSDWS